ncbi:MAG: putative transposase [Porticoccaceae bacterium]|jgi:putative transposase
MKCLPVCRTIRINGEQYFLWRTVDQDGEYTYTYTYTYSKAFFQTLNAVKRVEPLKIETDKLQSSDVAHRELMPNVIHSTTQHENNRAEQSHEATKVWERGMRKFKSARQAQNFLGTHAAVYNLFCLGRYLLGTQHY